jgi:hypothetical protein
MSGASAASIKRTAIAVQRHHLVVRQGLQHGPDTHAADVEHFGELIFDQPDTGQDAPFDDGGVDLGVDGRLFRLPGGVRGAPRLRSDGSNVHLAARL